MTSMLLRKRPGTPHTILRGRSVAVPGPGRATTIVPCLHFHINKQLHSLESFLMALFRCLSVRFLEPCTWEAMKQEHQEATAATLQAPPL